MTKRKGNYKPGPGRPKNGDFPNRESVRLTDEQKAHLIKKYGGVTAGIRRLIAADMEADGERKG